MDETMAIEPDIADDARENVDSMDNVEVDSSLQQSDCAPQNTDDEAPAVDVFSVYISLSGISVTV